MSFTTFFFLKEKRFVFEIISLICSNIFTLFRKLLLHIPSNNIEMVHFNIFPFDFCYVLYFFIGFVDINHIKFLKFPHLLGCFFFYSMPSLPSKKKLLLLLLLPFRFSLLQQLKDNSLINFLVKLNWV